MKNKPVKDTDIYQAKSGDGKLEESAAVAKIATAQKERKREVTRSRDYEK